MSSEKGNAVKSKQPKYRNKTAFRNDLHDTSKKTKIINTLQVTGCCARCKDIIDWKIKYKKYKPLTAPKRCVKCNEKAVKRSYFIVCQSCSERLQLCGKCGQNKDIVLKPGLSEAELASQHAQLEQELSLLPERQRRTFFRLQASGKLCGDEECGHSHDRPCDDKTCKSTNKTKKRVTDNCDGTDCHTSEDGDDSDVDEDSEDDSDCDEDDVDIPQSSMKPCTKVAQHEDVVVTGLDKLVTS